MRRSIPAGLALVLLGSPALGAGGKRRRVAAPPASRTTIPATEAPGADAPGMHHPEGEYGGVVPGQSPKDAGKPKHPPPKGTLSWIGFEAKDGGAQIFLQSIAPFEITQHVEGATLVIELAGIDRLGQNTWRPIDTRFFDTPVAQIVAKRARGRRGYEVAITFKSAKDAREASVRTATEADGYYYTYLTVGGSAPEPSMQQPEK